MKKIWTGRKVEHKKKGNLNCKQKGKEKGYDSKKLRMSLNREDKLSLSSELILIIMWKEE